MVENFSNIRIPVCEPTLEESDLRGLNDAFRSGWISGNGPSVKELEESFCEFLGAKYAIAVNTGTAAVHLMLLSVGLKAGDEVIVPTFTMAGSIFPLLYSGIKPIFIDSDIKTWCMNSELIEESITPNTKAIMAVHIYGFPCDMDRIREIADRHNLIVLEDSAEALGSEWNGKKCGTFGLASAFSLFANKVVTSGEGGIIVTDDEKVAMRAQKLRNLSFPTVGERRYFHDEVGYNYRLSNLLAALGISQMKRVDKLVASRVRNLNSYRGLLSKINSIHFQPEGFNLINSAWMVGVKIDYSSDDVSFIRKFLDKKGIETRPFFEPMHSQPALNAHSKSPTDFPVAEVLSKSGFYLPSSSHLTDVEIIRVCDSLIEALSATSSSR
jgi:perosamine synthetase